MYKDPNLTANRLLARETALARADFHAVGRKVGPGPRDAAPNPVDARCRRITINPEPGEVT
jgi:hypothetical protein